MITRQEIARHLTDYLNHHTSLAELVDWAENSIMKGGAEENYEKVIMQALGRIAAADVKDFGLLWEDCDDIMKQLGYSVKVDFLKVA
ncbi:MAG: hypothetical protein HY063_04875 [Bacteroidetes bacterium]|nr:hypothetical protein [Bacteroidota bacterium]